MKSKIIFLCLFSLSVQAQNCGTVNDGEVVRLDTETGTLRNSRAQDQDGLGTCYANTASVMLQSAIPSSPNISYINLAVSYAEKENGKTPYTAYDSSGQLLVTGGTICKTISIAKKNGGVCKRSDVPLEEIMFKNNIDFSSDSFHTQKDVFNKVSKYYDDVSKLFPAEKKPIISPEVSKNIEGSLINLNDKMSDVGKQLGTFFGSVGSKFKKFFDSVLDKKKQPPVEIEIIDLKAKAAPSEVVVKSIDDNLDMTNKEVIKTDPKLFSREKFESLRLSQKVLNNKEKYQLALYNLIQKKMPDYSLKNCENLDPKNALVVTQNLNALFYNADRANKISNFETRLRFKIYGQATIFNTGVAQKVVFETNQDFKNAIQEVYLKNLSQTPAPKSGRDAFIAAIKSVFPEATNDQLNDILNRLDPETNSLLEDDHDRYAKKDYSKCSQDKLAYLVNDDGLKKDFAEDPCLSQYLGQADQIKNLVTGLDKANIASFEKIADFILNSPDMNYEEAFMKLLAPTCTDDQKIKVPENLSCKDHEISFSQNDTSTEEKLNEKMRNERMKLFANTQQSINNGRAIGASLCTVFFKEDTNSFYNKTNLCQVTQGDSLHAVTVVGYRCKAGKVDYLIQNSWGDWRQLDDTKYQRDDKFGKAWIDEDSFIKNTYQYSTLNN